MSRDLFLHNSQYFVNYSVVYIWLLFLFNLFTSHFYGGLVQGLALLVCPLRSEQCSAQSIWMTILIMPFCETNEDRHALKNHTFTILQFMWVICLVLCSWPNTASIKIALGTFYEEGIFFRAHWENEQNSPSCVRRMRRCWLFTWGSSPRVSLQQEFTRPVKGKGDFSGAVFHTAM